MFFFFVIQFENKDILAIKTNTETNCCHLICILFAGSANLNNKPIIHWMAEVFNTTLKVTTKKRNQQLEFLLIINLLLKSTNVNKRL